VNDIAGAGAIVLDTNVVSEPLKPAPNENVLAYLQQASPRTFVTTVTLAELFLGAHQLDAGRRRERLLKNIATVREVYEQRTLPFTAAAAEHYGQSVAALKRAGVAISVADAFIAAICVTSDAALCTRNSNDFVQYPGLSVIDPWAGG